MKAKPCALCGYGDIPTPMPGDGIYCPDCYDGAPDNPNRNHFVMWCGSEELTIEAWNELQEQTEGELS